MSYDPEEPEDDNDAEQHRKQARSIRAKIIAEMGEANYKIICKRKCSHYKYQQTFDAVPHMHAEVLCYLIHKSALYCSHVAHKGWFYKTMGEMMRALRLTKSQQTKYVRDLKQWGILKFKMKEGRRHLKINYNRISEMIQDKAETERRSKGKKGGRIPLEAIHKKGTPDPSKKDTLPFSTYKKRG